MIHLKNAYWSFLCLHKHDKLEAFRYLRTFLTSRGLAGHCIITGDFLWGNFGDINTARLLQDSLRIKTYLVTPPMYAPFASAVLVGGGGLIRPAAPYSLSQYFNSMDQAIPTGFAAIGVNQNFNSQNPEPNWAKKVGESLKQCKFITVRDPLTLSYLENENITVDALTPDLSFLGGDLTQPVTSEPRITIFPCSDFCQNLSQRDLIIRKYQAVVRFALKEGFEVVLASLGNDPRKSNDLDLCKQINAEFDLGTSVYQPIKTHRQMKQLILSSAACISGRLHGAVYATSFGIPCLIAAYNEKQLGFSILTKQQDLVADSLQDNHSFWVDRCRQMISELNLRQQLIRKHAKKLISTTKQHVECFNSWIKAPDCLPMNLEKLSI